MPERSDNYKIKHFRIPVWMNEEIQNLVAVLKRQDSRWSENKIVIEAIRYWLNHLKNSKETSNV